MLLNFDIWSEIISYLEYPDDGPTLRSLAITSSLPSCAALDAIWRNGERISTIVSVINSFAQPNDEPFLEYKSSSVDFEGKGSGGWVLNRPLPHSSRSRVKRYFARIRKLMVFPSRPPNKEMLLLRVLPHCLDSPQPLLPHLQCLDIKRASCKCTDWLAPFLSPTLKVLNITTARTPEHEFVLSVLDLLVAYDCDLQVFTYNGGPVQRTPEKLTLFKNLQDVQLVQDHPLQKESSITVIEFFALLPSLRSLACNLTIFSHCATEDVFTHCGLQKFHIVSPAIKLHELLRRCIFPSVMEARITKQGFDAFGFKHLGSCCPNVRKLYLRANPIIDISATPTMDFQHLSPLLALPMQVFELVAAKIILIPADFRAVSESWPNLHSFTIWSINDYELEPLSSVAAFSGHRHLCYLDLGLRPSYFLNDVTKVPDLMAIQVVTRPSPSVLHTLYFAPTFHGSGQTGTTTMGEKYMLVKYLLSVFPCLTGLESKYRLYDDFLDGKVLKELQEILLEVKKGKE